MSGVMLKLPEALFNPPPVGPVNVKLPASAVADGVTGLLEAGVAVPGPTMLSACTDTL